MEKQLFHVAGGWPRMREQVESTVTLQDAHIYDSEIDLQTATRTLFERPGQ
jgi:hypothetical protein